MTDDRSAKDYLLQLLILKKRIARAKQELAEVRELALCIGSFDYSKDPVKTSKKGDNIENRIVKIDEVERKLSRLIVDYLEKAEEIRWRIGMVENETFKELLLMRYADGLKLEEISVKLGYSYNHVRHLHGLALLEFERANEDIFKS